MPRVSVLIATLDRPELLRGCLEALCACRPGADEILVADQSVGDASREVVEGLSSCADGSLRHLRIEARGKGKALNQALLQAKGDLIALTDDDVMVPADWIERLRALATQSQDFGAFCGRVSPEPGTDPADYLNLVSGEEERVIDRSTNALATSFCGANVAVRREVLERVGGYNEHFGPGGLFKNCDDGELAFRLTRAGERILFSPDLEVTHSGWRKESDNLALRASYAHGLGAFAGSTLRYREVVPTLRLVGMVLHKAFRGLRGLVTADRTRAADGWIHVRELLHGFCRGVGRGPKLANFGGDR